MRDCKQNGATPHIEINIKDAITNLRERWEVIERSSFSILFPYPVEKKQIQQDKNTEPTDWNAKKKGETKQDLHAAKETPFQVDVKLLNLRFWMFYHFRRRHPSTVAT